MYENSKSIAPLVEKGNRPSTELLWDRTFLEGGLSVTHHTQETLVMCS